MAEAIGELVIDQEFADLIQPHSEGEVAGLERSILEQGCSDPLTVWKGHGIILDGHTRYRICRERGQAFQTVEEDLPDREAAKGWILDHQMSRRNLIREAASYIRGKRYLEIKQTCSPGRPKKGAQSDPRKTSERLAEQYKVGAATIKRDARFALGVDRIVENCGAEAQKLILSRDYGMTRGAVRMARMTAEEQREFLGRLKKDKKTPRKETGKDKTSAKVMAESLVQRLSKRGEQHALDVLRRAVGMLGWTLAKKGEE